MTIRPDIKILDKRGDQEEMAYSSPTSQTRIIAPRIQSTYQNNASLSELRTNAETKTSRCLRNSADRFTKVMPGKALYSPRQIYLSTEISPRTDIAIMSRNLNQNEQARTASFRKMKDRLSEDEIIGVTPKSKRGKPQVISFLQHRLNKVRNQAISKSIMF